MTSKKKQPYDDGWIAWQCELAKSLEAEGVRIVDVDEQLMEVLYVVARDVPDAVTRIVKVAKRYKALMPTTGDKLYIPEDKTPECLGGDKCRFICGGGVAHCSACGYVDEPGAGFG